MQDGSQVQEISTRFFFLNTLSQLRQFVVEVGLVLKVCVVKRGGIIEDNSKMPGNFYSSDCSYEPGQD